MTMNGFKLYCKGFRKRRECQNCSYYVRGKSLRLLKNDGYKIYVPPTIGAYSKYRIKYLCKFKPCEV